MKINQNISPVKQPTNQLQNQIFQAQKTLNQEVQHALAQFRSKLSQNLNDRIAHSIQKSKYDISKQGPQKIFKFRQSLLSLMFNISDIKTLYNMACASFAILTFCLLYDNYVSYGQFIDGNQFTKVFLGAQKVFLSWWIMAIMHFSIIIITKISLMANKFLWIPLYISHIAMISIYAVNVTRNESLGFASTVIVMAEAARMLMKSHSYFRTKMLYCTNNPYKQYMTEPLTLKHHKVVIKMDDVFMEVKRLSYFFVAPTLIYRDQYTLTPIRDLSRIVVHVINFLLSFLLYIMSCKPTIQNLQQKLDRPTFILSVIKLMLPSVCFLILGFFGFLHSWLNAWAQITRFPDRAFYSDWWNSVQFGSYYRKWNIVVHDWLYYYVYLDLSRFFMICRRSKLLAKLLTFLISAVVHQIIVCVSIGFFYPILFMLFTGPGIILIQNHQRLKAISNNLFFWIEMYIGTAMLFSFYLVESFARKQVSEQLMQTMWGSLSPIIPRTIYLGQH